jgi:ketosteroid isomerase-like protein
MIISMIAKRMGRSSFDIMSQDHIDTDALLKVYADDCTYGGTSDFGVEATVKGKKAITEWLRNWEKEFPKRRFEVKNIAFAAWPLMPTNVVLIDWTLTEVNKEGKEFRYNGYSVCHMKNFKMVRGHDYMVSCGPSSTPNPD